MKKLLLILLMLPVIAYSKPKRSYTTKTGLLITESDSVRVLKPPFVFTYPRKNVDEKLQEKYRIYLERTMFNKTYKIDRLYSTRYNGKLIDVIILNVPKASGTMARVEYFVEIERALQAAEVEIVKAKS